MNEQWVYRWHGEQPHEEIWKACVGFDLYEVSSHGNVRSHSKKKKGANLKPSVSKGYPAVKLFDGFMFKSKTIHSLMADAFFGVCPIKGYITDHINNIKTDNRIVNLQRTTYRVNNSKDAKRKALFPGITKHHRGNRWVAQIEINNKHKTLGSAVTQEEAYQIYLKGKMMFGLP